MQVDRRCQVEDAKSDAGTWKGGLPEQCQPEDRPGVRRGRQPAEYEWHTEETGQVLSNKLEEDVQQPAVAGAGEQCHRLERGICSVFRPDSVTMAARAP